MSEAPSTVDRAVWFDIPVADLDRAAAFYRKLLAIDVERVASDGFELCVHDSEGNRIALHSATDA